MKRIASAILIVAASQSALAQSRTFTFSGEVVSISDPLGFLDTVAIGDAVNGSFAYDPTQSPDSGFPPIPGLGVFAADTISATVGDIDFQPLPDSVIAALTGDDQPGLIPGSGDGPFDIVQFNGPLVPPAGTNQSPNVITSSNIRAVFQGDQNWLDGVALPNTDTIGLDNLLGVEVTIEFLQLSAPGPNGEPFSTVTSVATVRVDSLADANGTIATIGCRALQFAAPVARADFFDVSAFLNEFNAGSNAADINGDGILNFFDVSGFITEYSTACTN